jgi:hypothetical protein
MLQVMIQQQQVEVKLEMIIITLWEVTITIHLIQLLAVVLA